MTKYFDITKLPSNVKYNIKIGMRGSGRSNCYELHMALKKMQRLVSTSTSILWYLRQHLTDSAYELFCCKYVVLLSDGTRILSKKCNSCLEWQIDFIELVEDIEHEFAITGDITIFDYVN